MTEDHQRQRLIGQFVPHRKSHRTTRITNYLNDKCEMAQLNNSYGNYFITLIVMVLIYEEPSIHSSGTMFGSLSRGSLFVNIKYYY